MDAVIPYLFMYSFIYYYVYVTGAGGIKNLRFTFHCGTKGRNK